MLEMTNDFSILFQTPQDFYNGENLHLRGKRVPKVQLCERGGVRLNPTGTQKDGTSNVADSRTQFETNLQLHDNILRCP